MAHRKYETVVWNDKVKIIEHVELANCKKKDIAN